MSDSTVQTRLALTGDREVRGQLKQTQDAFRNLSQGVGGIIPQLSAIGGPTAAIGAGLLVLRTQIHLAVRAVDLLGRGFVDLARRGGEVAAISNRFERIASPGLLSRLQELAGHQVRGREIMTSYSQAMEVGLIPAREYEQWLSRIVRTAQDRGADPAEWLERFTQVLSGGGLENMRQMGVNVQAVMEQVRGLELSLESTEGRALALDLAAKQLDRTLKGVADNGASNLLDAWSESRNELGDYLDEMGRVVSTSPALLAAFESLSEALSGVGINATRAGAFVAAFARTILRQISSVAIFTEGVVVETVRGLSGMLELIRPLSAAGAHIPSGLQSMLPWLPPVDLIDRSVESLQQIESQAQRTQGALQGLNESMADAALVAPGGVGGLLGADGTSVTRRTRQPGDAIVAESVRAAAKAREEASSRAGGRGEDPVLRMQDEILERIQMREEAEAARAEREREEIRRTEMIQRAYGDGITDWMISRKEADREVADANREALQAQIELEREAHNMAIEMAEERRRIIIETASEYISAIGSMAGSVASATGMIGQHLQENLDTQIASLEAMGKNRQEIAALTKDQAKNVDTWRKVEGAALGIKYAIEGGGEIAKSIGSYPDPIGIAMHAASAAAYFVQSGLAFTKLAQTGGGSAGAGASTAKAVSSSFRPSQPDRVQTGQKVEKQAATVHYYSLGRTSSDLGRVLREADWMRERSGTQAQTPRGVTYG